MTTPAPTVPSLKESFLSAQTNLLSQPLAPSRTWRRANDAGGKPLPGRVIDDVVFAVNQTVRQHCRRVYPPQASCNVAEQIGGLYLREAEDRVRGSGIGRELDFVADNSIEALPPSWPVEKDTESDPAAAEEYEAFVQRLTELTEQRRDLRLRVRRLRRMEASIRPLSATKTTRMTEEEEEEEEEEDEKNDKVRVQENLITRGGAVEQELERMRVLLARVRGGVAALGGEPRGRDGLSNGVADLGGMAGGRKRALGEFLMDARVFPL